MRDVLHLWFLGILSVWSHHAWSLNVHLMPDCMTALQTTGYSNFKQSCWALMPHNGSVCLRCMDRQTAVSQWVSISGNRAFGHCSDLDLWPLTLKTFVAMAIHMLIARAKFHRVKRYCTTWNEQPLTDGQCTDGRHSARWQTRRYKPLATYCWQWMPRT